VEEIDWTSFYYGFRFPLSDPSPEKTETSRRDGMWRRQNSEGPIDDRWSSMRLEKDEKTGSIMIIESRMEWLTGNSGSQRTFYTTEMAFCEKSKDADNDTADQLSMPANDPLGRLVDSGRDRPNYREAVQRLPQYVQRAGTGSALQLFTLSQSPVRSFIPSCQTWVDLVDDRAESSPTQHLRLRIGSRQVRPLTEPTSTKITQGQQGDRPSVDDEIEKVFKTNDIVFWPPTFPESEPATARADALSELFKVLSPPGHSGDVQGVMRGGSLVFATGPGGEKQMRTLVLVSFDPSIRLRGLKAWGSAIRQDSPAAASRPCATTDRANLHGMDGGEEGTDISLHRESGYGANRPSPKGQSPGLGENAGTHSVIDKAPSILPGWCRLSRPMFEDIPAIGQGPLGFSFAP
jgi:hypothetical protein